MPEGIPHKDKFPKRDPETGRNAEFVPTDAHRATVRAMAAYGIPQDDIGKVVGCTKPTLEKYFRRELDVAMTEANAKVSQTLFKMATEDKNVTAAIFWLKTRAGWKEPAQGHEHKHDFGRAPTEDIERELSTLRARKRIAAGTGAMASGVSDESDGVLH